MKKNGWLTIILNVIILFVMSYTFHQSDVNINLGSLHISNSTILYIYYMFMLIFWCISVNQRVTAKNVRLYLNLSILFMVIWLSVRTVKFALPFEGHSVRLLWYMYYIGMIFIPLCGFFAAVCMDKEEQYKLPSKYHLLTLISIILVGGVLTNDTHQMVFKILPEFDLNHNYNAYTREVGYYIVAIWILVLALLMLTTLLKKSTVQRTKQRVKEPFFILLVGIIYALIYNFNDHLAIVEMTAGFITIIIAEWESCIQIGLIPSSSNFEAIFESTSLSTIITDENYNVIYKSKDAKELTMDDYKQSDSDVYLLDDNTRLKRSDINGGFVFYQEDISSLGRIIEELRLVRQQLLENNELLQAEVDLKSRKARAEAQNKLYDEIADSMSHLFDIVEKQINSDMSSFEKLRIIAVEGAYIKRYANLLILNQNNEKIHSEELEFCLKETADALKAGNVECEYTLNIKPLKSTTWVMMMYELIHEQIMYHYDTLKNVTIHVDDTHLKMMLNEDNFEIELEENV